MRMASSWCRIVRSRTWTPLSSGRGTSSAFKRRDENTPSFVLHSNIQHNQCADAANAQHNQNGFTVGDCDTQQTQCSQFKSGQTTGTGTGNQVSTIPSCQNYNINTYPSQPSSKGNSTSNPNKGNSTPTTSNGGQGNLQTFTGSLGNVLAPSVTKTADGQFQVQGNSNFKNLQTALGRSWYVDGVYENTHTHLFWAAMCNTTNVLMPPIRNTMTAASLWEIVIPKILNVNSRRNRQERRSANAGSDVRVRVLAPLSFTDLIPTVVSILPNNP